MPPRSRSGAPRSRSGGPPVKVWGEGPRSRSRSGGPRQGQSPGGSPRSRSEGPPWSRSGTNFFCPIFFFQNFFFSIPSPPPPPPGYDQEGGAGPEDSGQGGPPWSRSRSMSGGPTGPGQGLGAPLVQVKVCPPPLSRSKNAGSAGGTPLAVTQEDCLVRSSYTTKQLS